MKDNEELCEIVAGQIQYSYMRTSIYNAVCWAEPQSNEAIQEEIERCDARYYKPYPWNGTETAANTIARIDSLKVILKERLTNIK